MEQLGEKVAARTAMLAQIHARLGSIETRLIGLQTRLLAAILGVGAFLGTLMTVYRFW
jgi:hypothetical protein